LSELPAPEAVPRLREVVCLPTTARLMRSASERLGAAGMSPVSSTLTSALRAAAPRGGQE
jgi:hypothetical protein